MDKSFAYKQPINVTGNTLSVDNWYKSVDYYDAGQYLNSIEYLLKYLDTSISFNGKTNDIRLKLHHGSLLVDFSIKDGFYYVSASFVKLPDTAKVPIMRQVIELNFSYLVLSKIVLENDEMYFKFQDRIENCEPYKLYYILEEICYCGDNNDDVFIDKFQASFVHQPEVNHFPKDVKNNAYDLFTKTLNDALTASQFFETKRYFPSACDVLSIAIMQIDYTLAPQGLLGTELNNALNTLYEAGPIDQVIVKTKNKIKKILEWDRAKFDDYMFYSKYLVPFKKRAEIPFIQDRLYNNHLDAKDAYYNQAFMGSALICLYAIYNLYYNNTITDEVDKIFKTALINASEKNWKEAADILYKAITSVMEIKVNY